MGKVADPIVRSHDDPAEHISRGIRLASMLAVHQPGVAGILGRFGWSGYQAPSMLEFVRRDIEDGVRRNRFTRMPITLAFNIVTGAAMSAMHRMLETECRDDFSNCRSRGFARPGRRKRDGQRHIHLTADRGHHAVPGYAWPNAQRRTVGAVRDR
jgi:hypothetical protein